MLGPVLSCLQLPPIILILLWLLTCPTKFAYLTTVLNRAMLRADFSLINNLCDSVSCCKKLINYKTRFPFFLILLKY